MKVLRSESGNGQNDEWESWAAASTRDGGDNVLDAMIQAKTLVTRQNPKLPVNRGIE